MATVLERDVAVEPRPVLVTADMVAAMLDDSGLDKLRVELIDGELIDMPPQMSPHLVAKVLFARRLDKALGHRVDLLVAQDGCFKANSLNVPEPDVMVWKPSPGRKFVPAADVRLVVEICETTHRRDFGRKVGLYASAGVPEYWIADLVSRSVVVMWAPANGAYGERMEQPFGTPITSPTLGVGIETDGLE